MRDRRRSAARWVMIAAIVVDLGVLGIFKYYDFFTQASAEFAREVLGIAWMPVRADLVLPLGISFYTFQMIAYVVDLYFGRCDVIRNPVKLSLFMAFFPKLIAGPILRTSDLIEQLETRREFRAEQFIHGLDLIAIGLFKKVLIADQIGPVVDKVFADPSGLGTGTALLGMYGYAAQIYCDFSGYTDIGRGCAFCVGYKLPINFAMPYFSVNITEFWRRWHITLSSWLRDYLYIPLGGNRRGRMRTYFNLLATMTLGGLWHGASWNFVIWGVFHGAALAVTRWVHELLGIRADRPLLDRWWYRCVSTVVTFHIVCVGWVFFRAKDLASAGAILGRLVSFEFLSSADAARFGRVDLAITTGGIVLIGCVHLLGWFLTRRGLHRGRVYAFVRPIWYFAVIVGILLLGGRGPQQFIYRQF